MLDAIFGEVKLDVLLANHIVYQPIAALNPCKKHKIPLVTYLHGSAIEYTVKLDKRFHELALKGLQGCTGVISGNFEVRDRILNLFPDHREEILKKVRIVGIGVDTSLFFPIDKSERQKNIETLIKMEKKEGRTEEISKKLFQTIDDGHIKALTDFKNLYPNKYPDADLNKKLNAIPWNANILLFVGALTVGKGLQTIIAAMPGILSQIEKTYLLIAGNGAYRDVLEGFVYAISSGNKSAVMEIC